MFGDRVIAEFRGPWGIPVQIGASIVLLPLVFISFSGIPGDIVYDVVFVLLLVGSILLHELGHAWGCRVQGVRVRRVMIYGGGGFCEHDPTTHREDELIVAMGPIVNLTLWAVCSLIWPLMPVYDDLAWALHTTAYINLFLALLNLMPVYPLDGGRLFHILMRRIAGPALGTRIAGAVGLVIAVLWIPLVVLCFFTFGLVLFLLPPIRVHWEMVRGRVAEPDGPNPPGKS